ncbi:hypothetical protein [Streptomyces xiaopingdaonensis]|uniref:hypothetical protein n=1 Tax=Streptomyces xiaopingdaonensis TaxID=1565415 RepID=UPI00031EA1D9|nr:hypothetical protein [Streptomyces xiaopingdaonensis]
MSNPRDMRRAPWRTPNGGPAFFVSDDQDGMLAALADNAESTLTENARTTLQFADTVLARGAAEPIEVRYLAKTLYQSLQDALYVAELRGERLGMEE